MVTIIDIFSKFVAGYTIPTREAINVLKSLKATYSIPKKIVCDQGVEFPANIFKEFCEKYDIEVH